MSTSPFVHKPTSSSLPPRNLALAVATLTLAGCSLRDLDMLASGSSAPDAAPHSLATDGGPDTVPAPGARALYWVDSGNDAVWTAAIDGRSRRRLAMMPDPSFLRCIVVDGAGGKIYYSDSGLKRIQRANLDGSGVEDVVTGLDAPVGLAVDGAAGKLYFADQGAAPVIFRANLDGSVREPIITAGIMHPYGLVLDRAGGRLYFVDNEADVIFRASLDGKVVERMAVAGLMAPIEIALDSQGGKLYWSDLGPPPRIRRANLDGTGVEDVITQARSPGFSTPLGIAVDVLARKLYYVDGGGSSQDGIRQSELDGAGIRTIVEAGLSAPRGLAIE
jgi:DNA-binding beta-propeller fold protein YncE